jgi:hypothetical protein
MGQIRSLSFLSPGNFPDEDPYAGLEETLRLFEYGERLGFGGARIRQRHLEHGLARPGISELTLCLGGKALVVTL